MQLKMKTAVMAIVGVCGLGAITTTQTGCPLAATIAPVAVLTIEEAACVVEHYSEPVEKIFADCTQLGGTIDKSKSAAVSALSMSVAKKVGEEKAASVCH